MTKLLRFVRFAPRNLLIALLKIYRKIISPLYGQVCRYYPSCSSYALTALQQHGIVRGGIYAAKRLSRCHPWSEGGVDDVPQKDPAPQITRLGFVNWRAAGVKHTID